MNEIVARLIQELNSTAIDKKHRVFLGFDAFVDLVVRPIEKGNSTKIERYYSKMENFGQFLISKPGLNRSVELDLVRRKLGGNTPNVASALGHLGISYDCLAPFGKKTIDEVFLPLQKFGHLFSTGDPGLSIALEFLNGKLMLALNQDVNNLNWQRIKDNMPLSRLIDIIENSHMLCLLNWSELPHATDIFLGLKAEVLPSISPDKAILIDLSDCSRRNSNDLQEILGVLASFAQSGKVIFGLNENESQIVCNELGIDENKPDTEKAVELRARLNLHWVVFHNRCRSILASDEGVFSFQTRMNSQPVLQTGAGDHFNAGLCRGYLDGMDPELCLILASLTSGYYVENGQSANINELIEYMKKMEE